MRGDVPPALTGFLGSKVRRQNASCDASNGQQGETYSDPETWIMSCRQMSSSNGMGKGDKCEKG